MLSFPRDWIVNIPGYAPQEITNSYILGGPKLTIDTIRSVTGITPNYYVSVDFDAFTQTVNAFNGAYVDVDRRYYNLNTNSSAHELQLDRHPAGLPADARSGGARVRASPPRRRRHVPARAPAAVPARVQGEARPDQHRPQPDDAARHGEEEPQDHRQEADVDRRHGAVREHAPVDPEEQHGQRAVRRARASDPGRPHRRRPVRDRQRRSTSSSIPIRRRPTAPPTRPPARSRRPARSTTRPRSRSRCATATARSARRPTSSRSS